MKTLSLSLLALVAMASLAPLGRADDSPTRTIDQTYTFDRGGDAVVDSTSTFSAAQWVDWKQRFGDHPDVLLRDMRSSFPGAVIDDFSLEKNEVHRQASTKIEARGMARYGNNGEFVIDVARDLKLVTGSGSDWFFTNSAPVNGVLITQNLKAKLPDGVTNASFLQGGDFNRLTYSLDVRPVRSRIWLAGGLALVGIGLSLGVCSVFLGKRKTTTVTIIPPSPPAAPPNLPAGG